MAYCEKCNKQGFSPNQMYVDQEKKIFVGPCCATEELTPAMHVVGDTPVPKPGTVIQIPRNLNDVDYGLEISNSVGVRAYVQYSGFQLSFERSPYEIKKWAKEQGIIETA